MKKEKKIQSEPSVETHPNGINHGRQSIGRKKVDGSISGASHIDFTSPGNI
jgi:hypothetical protein